MEHVQDDLTSISDTKELLREQTRALRALLKIVQERDEREKVTHGKLATAANRVWRAVVAAVKDLEN